MPNDPTRALLLRAALLLSAATTARLAAILLETRPLAGELAAVLAVDWLATRAGASWHADAGAGAAPAWRGWAKGAGISSGAVAAAVVAALAMGAGALVPRSLSALTIGLGLLHALALGVRDELLYRWMPARCLGRELPSWAIAPLCVALGVAPVALSGNAAAIAIAAGQGALSTALLLRGSPFSALAGANAAVVFLTSTLLTSTIELSLRVGSLSPLPSANGPAAYLLAGGLAAAAAAAWRWLPPAPAPPFTRPA
jgi:hypothetical protein